LSWTGDDFVYIAFGGLLASGRFNFSLQLGNEVRTAVVPEPSAGTPLSLGLVVLGTCGAGRRRLALRARRAGQQ
jgi:hypothetical protein